MADFFAARFIVALDGLAGAVSNERKKAFGTSGAFCAKHPKGEFLAKGFGHFFYRTILDAERRGDD
ncbi:MAG: hypothetical protein EA381_17175 [Planctomycetaceae bacterium]|nr:MAG: hypothetical protein EA381_17175 [Planctomycetaceae bacterium]